MLKRLWRVVTQAALKWWNDNALRLSAALSYYTLFSLAPLLIVVIAVAGFVFGAEAVQRTVLAQIQGLVGEQSAAAIRGMLESARQPITGSLAAGISLIVTVILATGVFTELQDALNTIWRIKSPAQGWWATVRDRFFSFMLVIGIGFLLVVSLFMSTAVALLGRFLTLLLPGPEFFLQLVDGAVSFVIFTLFFAMMFKVLPNAHIAWRDVWIGAAVTTVLFTVGKFGIGVYLGKSGVASAYGAASSLAVILLWVYYSALIFFFGAEFTYVYANEYGSRIRAVPEREQTVGASPHVSSFSGRQQTSGGTIGRA
jgi:membrane protein